VAKPAGSAALVLVHYAVPLHPEETLFEGWRGQHAARRPITAAQLGKRLRLLGIEAQAARRGALLHLGASLPAAVLARLLGLHPNTAVKWVRAAGGDWNTSHAPQVG